MILSSKFIITIFLIISMCLLTDAQFFFPFGNGMAQIPAYNNQRYGYTYGSGAVKDSEGFFPLCRGWTCNSNT